MKKHLIPILAIIAISSILRIWDLGKISLRLSLQDIHLGTFLTSAFLIPPPFAVVGTVSI